MEKYRIAFDAICADPRYQANIEWGEPRKGHPEGSVAQHIHELESNLTQLRSRLSEEEFWKLRLLIHVHDTFKAESKPGVAIAHPESHASLARAFLAEFLDERDLLEMVQLHDEPFALYQQDSRQGRFNENRWSAMRKTIQDWDLFLAFNIIDGCTLGKSRDPLVWLFQRAESERFTAADILAQ